MKVVDDFLSPFLLNKIKKEVYSRSFNWFYSPWTIYETKESEDNLGNYQFTHSFYDESNGGIVCDRYHLFTPFIEKLGCKKIIRLKANLNPVTQEHYVHEFHADVGEYYSGSKSAILYLNTNNGYTIFDTGERVYSVENRVLMFDSEKIHAGVTCTDQKVRVIINVVYF